MERHRNSIEYEVWGRYALFSEVATRVGGEKCSYQVPTYQALKGITESIYWKPTFKWVIDAVRVMNKIQTESKGVRPIKMSGGNDLSYYTYLKDVRYQVLAHFEWNDQREELAGDRDENRMTKPWRKCHYGQLKESCVSRIRVLRLLLWGAAANWAFLWHSIHREVIITVPC